MKKSLEEYELALEIDPNNYWAALGLGNLYLGLNDKEKVILPSELRQMEYQSFINV